MYTWMPAAYRPSVASPAIGLYRPTFLGARERPLLGQTFDEILGIPPAGGDLLRLLGHGSGAWFGLYIGMRPDMSTVLRVVGWIMGSGMGIAALLDLLSLGKRLAGTHPEPDPAEPEQSP